MAMAAEEIGAVSAMPITTLTKMPIGMGCNSVAILINEPSAVINALMPGPIQLATRPPITIVTKGSATISTFVLPASRPAISAPAKEDTYAPTGPPKE